MHPYYTVLPPKNVDYDALIHGASTTIPYFTAKIKSPLDGNTYTYSIAGTNPSTNKVSTNLVYVPIVAVIKFPGGVTLDPTKPGCNDSVSVSDRFYKGPNFVPTSLSSNGVNVGKVQINDGDMRAQWWKLVQGSNYHLVLKASVSSPIVVNLTAPSGSTTQAGVCSGASHDLGEIPINAYDSLVQSLATKYAKVNQVPLVLSYNVVETEGGCCVIGYHSAFGRSGGTQVYSVGSYMDPGFFNVPIEDIHAWTHEIGELMNDPFVNNGTPAWGHVGQVSGCQNNLEVGDPLTGIPFIKKYNGFTYHPQELAFFDWFFRTPAEGTGGKYSFRGTFTTAQGACN